MLTDILVCVMDLKLSRVYDCDAEKAEAARLLSRFHDEIEERSRWDYVDPKPKMPNSQSW